MGTGLNTNYESIIKQAESMLGQVSGGSNGSSSFNPEAFFQLGNILNGSKNSSNGTYNSNNKNQMVNQIVNGVISLLKSLGTSEAKAASAENKKASKKANDLIKEEEKVKEELLNQTAKIAEQMLDNTDIVSSCNSSLAAINKELQDKQEELASYVEQLEAERKALETCKPEEKESHLNNILTLSGSIAGLTTSVAELQSQVIDLSTDVENSYTTMEELKGNSVEVQETGEAIIQTLAQKGGELVAANANMQIKGVTNSATGQAAQSAAQTASSSIIGSGAAVKLYKVANDQNQAGATRTAGAVGNLQTVLQGIGGLSEHLSVLAEFKNAIGNIDQGFTGLIGEWNNAIEPTITSIGSWQIVQDKNTELSATVQADLSQVENTQEENTDTKAQTVNFDMQALNPFKKQDIKVEKAS